MERLHLGLLGPFEVRADGEAPVRIASRKTIGLLAYLALHPGEELSRETLAGLLWGRSDTDHARASLRQSIASLRGTLSAAGWDGLRVGRDSIAAEGSALDVDVHALEALAGSARGGELSRAAGLCRGPFLEGHFSREPEFAEWVEGERLRLQELALAVLWRLLRLQLGEGQTEPAIETAVRLIRLDPLQEPAHRALMELYVRQDRRAAAIAQYRNLERLLRRELDVAPEPETTALLRDIARSRHAAAPPRSMNDGADVVWKPAALVPAAGSETEAVAEQPGRPLRQAHPSHATGAPLDEDRHPAAAEHLPDDPTDDLDARPLGSSPDATPLPVVPSRDDADREHVPERRQVTVFSCGLVGLSPELDPEDMHEALTVLRETCVHSMADTAVTIRQTATGTLAVFGYPRASGDDVERAVRAALGIVAAARGRRLPDGSSLRIRCGIATGPVVVGHGDGRSSVAARDEIVGGVLRRAEQLQSEAEPGTVLISDATHSLIGDLFDCAPLEARSAETAGEPAATYRVIGHGSAESRFAALRAAKAMTPLVGRRHELTLLQDRWEAARDGEGQVVLVSGEPGMGKSRLVEELWAQFRTRPATRIRFDCSPHHTTSALHPVRVQLERACGIRPDDPPAAKLEKLEAAFGGADGLAADALALLAEQLGVGLPDDASALDLSPRQKKARTFEILVDLVVAYAAHGPVLLVAEDVHWADPSTLEYLDALVHRIPDLPVLVVMTFRPELIAPWSAYPHATTLSLHRLAGRQVVQLAGLAAGGRMVSEAMLASIRERSDGIPLFVEELTRALLDHATGRTGNRADMPDASTARQAIPASLQDLLLARLDRAAGTKEIAQIAACIGREFEHGLLMTVADMSEHRLQEAIEQLVAGDLIFRRQGANATTYVFKHALIRDAAYDSLLKGDRQQVHARILDALPRHAGNTPAEILAQHAAAAGKVETAVALWRQAAQSAMARSAYAEAAAHLLSALALIEPQALQGNEAVCAALHLELAAAIYAVKGRGAEEVREAYARAEELSRGRDPHRRFVALRGLWNYHAVQGELDLATPLADEIIRLSKQSKRRVEALVACRVGATSGYQRGDLAAAKRHADAGSERWDPRWDSEHFAIYGEDPGLFCTTYGVWIDDAMGYRDSALRKASRALDGARASPNRFIYGVALGYVSMLHQYRRDPPAVLRIADEAIQLCDAHGIAQHRAMATAMRGWARVYLGEAEDGIEELTRGIDAWRSIPMRFVLPHLLTLLAEALQDAGRLAEARDTVEEAAQLTATTGYHIYASEIARVRAGLLLAAGDWRAAERALLGALRTARKQGARTHELRAATALARLWQATAKRSRGRDLLRHSLEAFTEGMDTVDLLQARDVLESLGRDSLPESARSR